MNKYLQNISLLSFIFFASYSSYAISPQLEKIKTQEGQLQDSNMQVPKQRTKIWNAHSEFGDRVINHWTSRSLDEIKQKGKVDVPRVLLANLVANKNISPTNAFIMNMHFCIFFVHIKVVFMLEIY